MNDQQKLYSMMAILEEEQKKLVAIRKTVEVLVVNLSKHHESFKNLPFSIQDELSKSVKSSIVPVTNEIKTHVISGLNEAILDTSNKLTILRSKTLELHQNMNEAGSFIHAQKFTIIVALSVLVFCVITIFFTLFNFQSQLTEVKNSVDQFSSKLEMAKSKKKSANAKKN